MSGPEPADRDPAPRELVPGLWRWTTRHPEWHPGEWGSEVACYALRAGDDVLLVDPLLPSGESGPVHDVVDALCDAERIAILITIPYHVRSAEPLWERCRDRLPASIHGHPSVAKRLASTAGFEPLEPGVEAPGGAVGFEIGKPRRYELPIHLPSHSAIAFGDSVVEWEGRVRMWSPQELDDKRVAFYRDRFAPTLEPLVALEAENLLITHGEAVLGDGAEQLRRAVGTPPWHHPG